MYSGIIYSATHNINRRVYVGQTIQTLKRRQKQHSTCSKKPKNAFQSALHKEGTEMFEWRTEYIIFSEDKNDLTGLLNKKEKEVSLKFNSMYPFGYNHKVGNGKGAFSDATKKLMSESHKGVKLPKERVQKSVEGHIKTYCLISPCGEQVIITNLREFCKDTNLSDSHLRSVAVGTRSQHKGWKSIIPAKKKVRKEISEAGRNNISESRAKKTYTLISPEGDITHINNLKNFCKNNNLNNSNLYRVVNGKSKSHKGWRVA